MSSYGELLSGVALLVAAETILYSLWYPDIRKALDAEVKPHCEDNEGAHTEARGALNTKAWPLCLAAMATAIVFLPDAARIIIGVFVYASRMNFAVADYDAVQACVVLAEVFAFSLFFLTWSLCRSLRVKIAKLNSKAP